ncbi:hypothetical protein ABPG77_001492 [Micractinium sp. CCAP 211/92]
MAPRLLLLAALAGLLACAAAGPLTAVCAGKQDNFYGISRNQYRDTSKKNFVQQAFLKLEPWIAKDLIRRGIMEGCTFDDSVLAIAPDSRACYKTVAYNKQGQAAKGQYGFESFELDFMCPEGINGPTPVQVLKHLECNAIAYTNRDGSWWKTPAYTCQ